MSLRLLCLIAATHLAAAAFPQTNGSPLIHAYPREVYGGAIGQVFDGGQSERGILYFATADSGLLEFDGERWRSNQTEGLFLSLDIDGQERIWQAGVNRIGYFAADDQGRLQWADMTSLLAEEERSFSDTWPVLSTKDGVFFASREFLFRYRDEPTPHFDSWPGSSDEFFYRLYDLDSRFFVAQLGVGLLELTAEDELVELGAGELAGAAEVNALFSLGQDNYLVLTRSHGTFRLQGKSLEPWIGEASRWLQEKHVQYGCELPDGRFAIATRRGGIAIIDRDLRLLRVIDESDGLNRNSVSILFLDARENLWAGTANGINHIMLETAVAGFDASDGLPESAVNKVVRNGDELYVASLVGLFRSRQVETLDGPDIRFDGSPLLESQIWDLLPLDDSFLIAATDGVHELLARGSGGMTLTSTVPLMPVPSTNLLPLPSAPGEEEVEQIVVGISGGLGLVEKHDGQWKYSGRLQGLKHAAWDLALGEDREILAALPDLDQTAIIHFKAGFEQEPEVFIHDSFGGFVELDDGLYLTDGGIFSRYQGLSAARDGAPFASDPELSQLGSIGVNWILLEDSQGRLWVNTERGLRIARRLEAGGFELLPVSHQLIESPFSVFEDPVLEDTFWLGTAAGLIRVNPQTGEAPSFAPPTLIRRVAALSSGRELDGGACGEVPPPRLDYSENALRFEFAAPAYEQNIEMLYRVRLDGFDETWTAWSEENYKEYTSLAEGHYIFRVQAQDALGSLGPPAAWAFTIEPPWFRTGWAFAGYFLTAIASVFLLVWTRTGRLEKRRFALEKLVEARTVELASEKDQVERQARDLERVNHLLAEENEHRRQLEAERAKLQERAEQSQKLESLGLMAGGIAHDFNNILMAILGNADLCLEEDDLRPSLDRRLSAISDAGRRAAELCQQMLAYAGKGSFEERELDLSALTGETLEIIRVSIEEGITIKTDLDGDLPAILGDPSKISQLILNLFTNASEAIGQGPGLLKVETGTRHITADDQERLVLADPIPEGPYVFVRVEDDGEGMDEETRRRLFDPFFTTKFAGRGLGMAAALGILRSHAGAIAVDSEPGQGTTVEAYFPALDHHIDENVPKTPESVRQWRSGGTILVVDDEAVVRDVVELILRNTGFEVLTASSGQESLELYGAYRKEISAVVLDLTMPGLDGLATFERLQLLDPDVKVLLSSGYSGDTLIERYLEMGFAAFIAKPYRPGALRAALREILA